MHFAENLRYLRELNGEKQSDISQLLDVSKMAVSRYERGESEPDLRNVIILADHFNITIDQLIRWKLTEEVTV